MNAAIPQPGPCIYLGKPTGDVVACDDCKGKVELITYACAVHKTCTLGRFGKPIAGCKGCKDMAVKPPPPIAFAKTCTRYDQATRGCSIHGRCREADKVERGEVKSLAGCVDFVQLSTSNVRNRSLRIWAGSAAVRDQHIKELRQVVGSSHQPPNLLGEGVLLCGGGKYWPMVVVSVRMLREVSDLPVQIWHRGRAEPVRYEDVEGIPGVTIRDATQLQPTPRILGGWEVKTIAMRNCGWKTVLYLDADAYCVADPAPLLSLAGEGRFVFWSDLPHAISNIKWPWYGMPASKLPPIQGGQLVIDLETFWPELCIADWINQHSDYFYQHQYGDQDSWRVALAATRGSYKHLGAAPWSWPAFVCQLGNKPVVTHRCQGKIWSLAEAKPAMHLPKEDRVFHWLAVREVGQGDATAVFARIYATGHWGHGNKSGGGSTAVEAAPYLAIVHELLRSEGWEKVVDLGMGDGSIARRLDVASVTGVDCYLPHVERLQREQPDRTWLCLDIDRDRERLPCGDVALLKDVLQHWPASLIREWLAWAKSCGKWKALVITNDRLQLQPDPPLGGFRGLDLHKEPLKSLGLIRLNDYLHKSVLRLDALPRS